MNRASEQPSDLEMLAGEGKSFFMVRRLNPKNGHSMFVYVERGRCPIDVQFKDNTIELVYRKEVQVLKFLSFH